MKAFIKRSRAKAVRLVLIMLWVLMYLALMGIAVKTFLYLLKGAVDSKIFIPYITAIGLSVALASSAFSYARVYDEKRASLRRIGEFFFFGTISLITGFILTWFVGQLLGLFSENKYLQIVIAAVGSFNFIFMLYAADSIHSGIRHLQKVLFSELKDEL